MQITPALSGLSGMSGLVPLELLAGGGLPADPQRILQWALDPDTDPAYHPDQIDGKCILNPLEPHGTVRAPRGQACYDFDAGGATVFSVAIGGVLPVYPFTSWARFITGTPASFEGLFGINSSSVSGAYFSLILDVAAIFVARRHPVDGDIQTNIGAISLVDDGLQHDIVIVFTSPTEFVAYIDGSPTTYSGLTSVGVETSINQTTLGALRSVPPTWYFNGKLAGAGWWNFGFTQTQVDNLINDYALPPLPPEALYACNEEDGLVSLDASGNAAHGTITNMGAGFHGTDPAVTVNRANIVGWSQGSGWQDPGLLFDGVDDLIALQTTALDTINPTKNYAIRMTFQAGDLSPALAYTLFAANKTVTTELSGMELNSAGNLVLGNFNGSWSSVVAAIADTNEHVVMYRNTAGVVTGELDGVPMAVSGINPQTNTNGDRIRIGSSALNVRTWKGIISKVEIWGTAAAAGASSPDILYELDETSGDIAHDSAGSEDGTLTNFSDLIIPRNESDTANDVFGDTLQYEGLAPHPMIIESPLATFPGVSEYVDLGQGAAFDIDQVFDISVRVKFDSIATNRGIIGNRNAGATATNYWSVVLVATEEIRLMMVGNDASLKIIARQGIIVDRWYDVRIIFDGVAGNMEFVIDGVSAGTAIFTGTITPAGRSVYVGKEAGLLDGQVSLVSMSKAGNEVSRYEFQEGTGNLCHNTVANANHGVITSAALADVWANHNESVTKDICIERGGRTVATFDQVDDFINFGSTAPLDRTDDFTACARFRTSSLAGFGGLFSRLISSPLTGWALGFDGNGGQKSPAVLVGDGATFDWIHVDAEPALDEWHHLALTVTSGTSRLYLNGVLQAETTTHAIGASTVDAGCGKLYGNTFGNYYGGALKDVQYYDAPLSQPNIEFLSSEGATGTAPTPGNLVLDQPLDEQTGTTFRDRSGNGYDGTLVNVNGSIFWPFIPALLDESAAANGDPITLTKKHFGNSASRLDYDFWNAPKLQPINLPALTQPGELLRGVAPINTKLRSEQPLEQVGNFDGVDDYVDLPPAIVSRMSTLNDFSIGLDFFANGDTSLDQMLFTSTNVAASDRVAIYLNVSGGNWQIRAGAWDTTWVNRVTGFSVISPNTWYRVLCSYKAAPRTFSMWLDGVVQSDVGSPPLSGAESNKAVLGTINLLTGQWLNGKMRDVFVYDTELTDPSQEATANRIGEYLFEADATGTRVVDTSGDNNHATVVGDDGSEFWGTKPFPHGDDRIASLSQPAVGLQAVLDYLSTPP